MKKCLIFIFCFLISNVWASDTSPWPKEITTAWMMRRFKVQTNPEELKSLQKKAGEILDGIENAKQEKARRVAESICGGK